MNDELFAVKNSPLQGRGIFATHDIKKGQMICEFKGKEITIPELKKLYESGEERLDDPLQVAEEIYLDLDEPYIYFNHSCEPNAGMRGKGLLFAMKDIVPGEEITFDYSTSEWSNNEAWGIHWASEWKMLCKCGAEKCRGEVREFCMLPPSTQNFYRAEGALMDFILKKL